MLLRKYHGLGNDYLVLEQDPAAPTPAPALIRALCDRNRGPGGDGVLIAADGADADYGIRIFNPDGSEAEKSGNGLRIFARWLVERQGAPRSFSIRTISGLVRCEVDPRRIAVQMGRAQIFEPIAPSELGLPSAIRAAIPVSVGNPHLVLWTDTPDLDALPWRSWGERLEVEPRFPGRTNVQIARIGSADPIAGSSDRIHGSSDPWIRSDPGGAPIGSRGSNVSTAQLRIWERGAGETLASGSSSCAVAASAVATGRLGSGWIRAEMPGGILEIEVTDALELTLRGPVEAVGVFEMDPRWLAARGA